MNKLFAIIAVASLAASAHAADGKTDFKFGGSINQTFNMNNNPGFANANGVTETNWLQKNQFNVGAKTSDKLMGNIGMTHSAVWGGASSTPTTAYSTTTVGAPNTGSMTAQSTFAVTEAWMWWKATDSLSFKTGRAGVSFGDGFVVSKNESLPYPFYFDGVFGRWSFDFMDIDFGGAKTAETGIAGSQATDKEIVFYGANIGIKSLPDMFKKFDIFVAQANGDAGTGSATSYAVPGLSGTDSWNLMAYGLYTKVDVAMVDLAVNVAMQSGKQKAATDVTQSGMAYDLEVGLNLPEFMKARIYAGMHNSSGDDSTTADKLESYQPLFYDFGKYSAGDIWGFGNLSNMKVGLKLATSDATSFGFEMNMASRTTDKFTGTQSTLARHFGNSFTVPTTVDTAQKALGTVMSVWAKHDYGSGFSMMAGLNMIGMGSYYKPAGAQVADGMGVKLNASYNF